MLFRKYLEYFKNNDSTILNAIESSNMNIICSLKDLHHHCMLNESLIDNYTKETVGEASALVAVMLRDYTSFFEVKAMNNFTMRSYPFKLCDNFYIIKKIHNVHT